MFPKRLLREWEIGTPNFHQSFPACWGWDPGSCLWVPGSSANAHLCRLLPLSLYLPAIRARPFLAGRDRDKKRLRRERMEFALRRNRSYVLVLIT